MKETQQCLLWSAVPDSKGMYRLVPGHRAGGESAACTLPRAPVYDLPLLASPGGPGPFDGFHGSCFLLTGHGGSI